MVPPPSPLLRGRARARSLDSRPRPDARSLTAADRASSSAIGAVLTFDPSSSRVYAVLTATRPILAVLGPSSSTSTSRSSGPGRSSGRRRTAVGAGTGSSSTRSRYDAARLAALEDLQHHPELVHDEEIWITFTEDIVRGMGGDADGCARLRGRDRAPLGDPRQLRPLRRRAARRSRRSAAHGLGIGLISNGQRDLEEFARHHGLDVDVCVGSKSHGRTKPHPSIFETALAALGAPGRGGDGR